MAFYPFSEFYGIADLCKIVNNLNLNILWHLIWDLCISSALCVHGEKLSTKKDIILNFPPKTMTILKQMHILLKLMAPFEVS